MAARRGWVNWAAGNTKVYLEDGSYLKMREISLSYDLPSSLVGALFGGHRPVGPRHPERAAT